jgi:REP element-mobilizing transposase RayT
MNDSQMEESMFSIESMETNKEHVHMLVDIDKLSELNKCQLTGY